MINDRVVSRVGTFIVHGEDYITGVSSEFAFLQRTRYIHLVHEGERKANTIDERRNEQPTEGEYTDYEDYDGFRSD